MPLAIHEFEPLPLLSISKLIPIGRLTQVRLLRRSRHD